MGFNKGAKVHDTTNYKPTQYEGDDTEEIIEKIIEESDYVLDLTSKDEGYAISQAIGIRNDNGKPGDLVISFAKSKVNEDGEVEEDVVRGTAIIPLSHGFAFGNGIITALDKAADALVDDKVKQMVERIFGGDR